MMRLRFWRKPRLVVDAKDAYERVLTPEYQTVLWWMRTEGLVPENIKRIEVYGSRRPCATLTVYERDGDGRLVYDPVTWQAVTHMERVRLSSLPPLREV
ncbi:hypothetical protein ACIBQ6_22025 [Nonomuraea sp. NPDC049655]|uniref:hypothetical protein n=1 Tax=Nonomuraea sp. NPDC049655 TaxID=3364355 RepID=UPI0037B96DDC